MKIFPPFCARIEDQLPPSTLDADAGDIPGSRQMVNQGYSKVNKAMFESLQAIAKESPHHHSSHHPSTASGAVVGAGVDPEDKEQLNYHIMMIENMNHYVEEVDTRGNLVLAEFMRKAEMEYKEHMGLYVGAVIRRPLGKLLVCLPPSLIPLLPQLSSDLAPVIPGLHRISRRHPQIHSTNHRRNLLPAPLPLQARPEENPLPLRCKGNPTRGRDTAEEG